MARVSIFLTIIALIGGTIGCAPAPTQYSLTISSTEGGEVTDPGEGTFTYDEGEVVELVADPDEGYQFVDWSGDVSTVGNVNAAITIITTNDDYEITASFEETPTITFAVAGPMTGFPGEHQWWGAELACDEIDAGPGVNVGGVYHQVKLVQVDTNEISGTPDEGVAALEAVIDDVDFVLGGLETQSVVAYREVAMDAEKIFMYCGAATGFLQFSVVTDYDRYKYWFVSTVNEVFRVTSLYRIAKTIGIVLKNTLIAEGDAVAEDYRVPEDGKLRVAILMEDGEWSAGLVRAAQAHLPNLGFTIVGTWLVSPTATDITTELTQIAAAKPHIIFTAFQGPVAAVYSSQRVDLETPAMTIGLGDIGPQKEHWANTEGKCDGEVMLDAWAEGLENTPNTTAFFNAFVTKTGEYPIFTAATYYAVYCLKEGIEAVSAAHGWDDIADIVDPDNIDALVQYLEVHSHTGASPIVYYPMPEVDLGGGVYALSEEQVRVLYPSLEIYDQNGWKCASPTGAGPHIAHEPVYGPGYQTGIGSQWQDGHKVGIWPIDFGDASDAALTDQYGCWNFEYPGTVDVVIPIEGFLKP